MKKLLVITLSLLFFNSTLIANDYSNYSELSLKELNDKESALLVEQEYLQNELANTQNPTVTKSLSERLAEITAELSAVQKALVVVLGVGTISAITDDGYNDDVPPVITINGDNPATVELGTTYSDAGASASDAFHGSTNVTSSSNVDTSTAGEYTVTYTATDLSGNTATASRTVNVVDTIAPVITMTKEDNDSDGFNRVELGEAFTDPGATATDASGVANVTSTSNVDTDVVDHIKLYTATDASGNTSTATRTVSVSDTTGPVITMTKEDANDSDGFNRVELGTTFTDPEATATDASGEATITTSSNVDSDTVGHTKLYICNR